MSSLALGRDYVLSLERGLEVIQSFGRDAERMTLSEVARRTGLSRAASRRFLLTLTELGYVAFDGKRFSLTPRVLGLGYAYLASHTVVEVAQPILERVSERLHESCSLSVLDGAEIVYVARAPTKRIMSVTISIGTRLPAHATSMGQVLLAALAQEKLDAYLAATERKPYTPHTVTDEAQLRVLLARVAQQGYSLVDQELEAGLRSIAVPVRDRAGRVIAAMNVSSHAARASLGDMVKALLPPLRRAAADLTASLPN
ncbi:MAG: IclR family transcriptional regulator [Alphaproteobacteria bacterium]